MVEKTSKKMVKDQVVDMALEMASTRPWNELFFEDIIEKTGVDIADAREYFDDKDDILAAYGRRVDRKVSDNISLADDMSEREKIFDILMERFDAINEDRGAILSILNSFKSDPKQMVVSLPHLARSMSRTLDAAGVETDGIFGALRITGLIGAYLYTVRTWKEDDSADMSKTMAALDKALNYGEQAANSCQDGNLLSGLSVLCERFRKKDQA